MHLTIDNFRCYSHLSVSFEPNQIILVTGKSGSGKTTIFDTIYWCLYKKTPDNKSLNVAPLSGKNLKTTVKFEINDIKIIRTTKPATLTVTSEDGTITDSSAQSYINEIYGSSEYWLATSYITQDGRNPLFSGSQVVKTELIRRLCLDKDDPELFISKGKEKIKKLEGSYEANSKRFNDDVNDIRRSMSELKVTDDDIKNPPTIDSYRLTKLSECLESYQIKRASLITQRDHRQKLSNSIQDWKDRNCTEYIQEMEIIPHHWEQYEAYITQTIYREHLIGEMREIEDHLLLIPDGIIPIDDIAYSSDEILINRQVEARFRQNNKLADQVGVKYDAILIEEARSNLEEIISSAEKAQKSNQERQRILDQINRLNLRIAEQERRIKAEIDITPVMTECEELRRVVARQKTDKTNYKAELDQLTSKRPIKCPHCQKSVYFHQQRLEKFPEINPDEIARLREEIKVCNAITEESGKSLIDNERKIEQYQKQKKMSDMAAYAIKTLEIERDSLIIPDLVENEYLNKLEALKSQHKLLLRIEYVDEPELSSYQMEKHNHAVNLHRLREKLLPLKNKIDEMSTNHIEKPRMSKSEATKSIIKANWVMRVKEELNNLPEGIDELIAEVDREIDNMKEHICIEQELRLFHGSIVNIKKRCNELSNQKIKTEDEWKHIDSHARLLDYMIEAEHRVYQYTCDIINYHLSIIMHDLIPTVSMEVRTTKITSNKREKPTINLHGMKNGLEINLADLSGGEKDRCSMALTIALMKLSKSPVIILDETFSSLSDDEDREIAIRILEQHARSPEHVTFCVVHGGTTGWYDQLYACSHNSSA